MSPSSHNLIGRQLGKYRIQSLLGEGAMAWVFLAVDSALRANVALKILKPEFNGDPELVGRFQDEARSAAQLRHPNIVTVFDIGQADGLNYFAMDYLEGMSLRQLLDRDKRLPPARAIGILNQVAGALDWAHARRPDPFIHRDIKPENIMVGPEDRVTLVDYGLVKVGTATRRTRQGAVMGTYEYMSPEQVKGAVDVSPATDIWSLGVVAFELLTGRTPFFAENRTSTATMYKVANEPPPAARSLGPAVDRVLHKALAKSPAERWPNARAFTTALDGALRGVPTASTASPNLPLVALGVGLVAMLALFWAWSRSQAPSPRETPTATASVTEPAVILPTGIMPTLTVPPTGAVPTDTPVTPSPTSNPTRTATAAPKPVPIKPKPVDPPKPPPPVPVTESISFWNDGPQLNADTLCTSIAWDAKGFDHVFVWLEGTDRGPAKPASGREGNLCGIRPGDKAVFNLAAVRADGSEAFQTLEVRNEGDD